MNRLTASDILNDGPVNRQIAACYGEKVRKQFNVSANLETGVITYFVEINGRVSEFALADLEKAVDAFNAG